MLKGIDFNYRKLIPQLKSAIIRLNTEVGRYRHAVKNQRLCPLSVYTCNDPKDDFNVI